jgi:hypothetical protein
MQDFGIRGGDHTRALKVIVGLLVGGVAGQSVGQLATNASAPYLANTIGNYFSQPGNENKTAQVLSHAVLGGLLAAANGGSVDIILIQNTWHGFPDPPEWGLASRPAGQLSVR